MENYRCKNVIGVKREIGLVTTRSPSLRRKMIIHPLTLRPDTGAPVYVPGLTLNERFHLKTGPALSRVPNRTLVQPGLSLDSLDLILPSASLAGREEN